MAAREEANVADGPPAGWYPDPTQDGQLRWWDGSAWTEHVAPQEPESLAWPAAGEPASPPQGSPGGHGAGQYGTGAPGHGTGQYGTGQSAAGPYGQGTVSPPDSMLWQSILFTFCCFPPAGVFAIVFAAQSNQASRLGDYAEAARRASQAKRAMMVGLFLFLGLVVLGVIGVVTEQA